jgi:hypothetical protein
MPIIMNHTGVLDETNVSSGKPSAVQRARAREDAVLPGARRDLTGRHRRGHQADDHRQHREARLGRA